MGRTEKETNKTTTNYTFTYKVALPESKSLSDECKRPTMENAGLACKEEWEKDPLGNPMGHAEFWDSPGPI